MLALALFAVTSFQLVTSYVYPVERRGTVCQLPDGTTRTIGEKFTVGKSLCIKYECLQDGSWPYFYAGCQKRDGGCVDVNGTYNDGCTVRTCRFAEGKLTFVGDGCSDPEVGACKSTGDEWTVALASEANPLYGRCVSKRCDPGGYTNITNTQCLYQGACYALGDFVIDHKRCQKIQCVYDSADDSYIMLPSAAACRAENMTASWCLEIGSEGFPRLVDGVAYKDCKCFKKGNGIGYLC